MIIACLFFYVDNIPSKNTVKGFLVNLQCETCNLPFTNKILSRTGSV